MKPINRVDLDYICLNLRQTDREEILGLRGYNSPLFIANETIAAASFGKAAIAYHNNRPAVAVGVTPKPWPGVWDAWAFGTDDLPKCALSVTRYALNVLKPFVLGRGGHRIEAASRINHGQAHSWLRAMGATDEVLLRGYGRDGADYVLFSYVRTDNVHLPEDPRA